MSSLKEPKSFESISGEEAPTRNELIAEAPSFFIADLHLSSNNPEIASAFFDFLANTARQARSLFILGDLFEYWAGDDDIESPFNRRVCEALKEAASSGIAIYFMTGNRDLLVGKDFAHATGTRLLPDPATVRIGSRTLLLSHGDTLCTDDKDYQAFRLQVHDHAWQAAFLAQPLAVRRTIIEKARNQSEMAKRDKQGEIMDVNADTVVELLRTRDYPTPFIHGHTHRPGQHTYLLDGHRCERHVLSDWRDRPVWLAYDGAEFTAHN